MEKGTIFEADVIHTKTPDNKRYPDTNLDRMYLYILRFAAIAIQKDRQGLGIEDVPHLFTGPGEPQVDRVFFTNKLNLHGEDIYRAIQLWALYKFKRKNSTAADGSFTCYTGKPVLPIFMPKAGTVNTVEQAKRQARAFNNAAHKGVVRGDPSAELLRKWAETQDQDELETAETTNKVTNGPITLSSDIDTLSPEDLNALFDIITRPLDVLFDDPDRQNKTFFDSTATKRVKKEIEKEAADEILALDKPDDKKAAAKAAAAALRPGAGPVTIPDDVKARFLELQSSLNQRSAMPPDFFSAIEDLGMTCTDIPDGEVDPVTKQNFRIDSRGMSLMPWQPQGTQWMSMMINSEIGACLVADDAGIGKTIQSLELMLAESRRVTREREVWHQQFNHIRDRLIDLYRETLDDDDDYDDALSMEEYLERKSHRQPSRISNRTTGLQFGFDFLRKVKSNCWPVVQFCFSFFFCH